MVKNSSFSDNWLKLNKQMNVGVSCQLATPIYICNTKIETRLKESNMVSNIIVHELFYFVFELPSITRTKNEHEREENR